MIIYQGKFTEEQVKNLMVFLDRIELKGHTERYAMNEIEVALNDFKATKEELKKLDKTETK